MLANPTSAAGASGGILAAFWKQHRSEIRFIINQMKEGFLNA